MNNVVPRSINVRGTLPLVHPRRHEAWEDYDLQAARFALHPCLTPRIMSVIERAFLPRCRCTAECPEQDGLEDAEFPSRSPSPFDLRIGNCHALPSEGCNDESRMVLEHMSADTGIVSLGLLVFVACLSIDDIALELAFRYPFHRSW